MRRPGRPTRPSDAGGRSGRSAGGLPLPADESPGGGVRRIDAPHAATAAVGGVGADRRLAAVGEVAVTVAEAGSALIHACAVDAGGLPAGTPRARTAARA